MKEANKTEGQMSKRDYMVYYTYKRAYLAAKFTKNFINITNYILENSDVISVDQLDSTYPNQVTDQQSLELMFTDDGFPWPLVDGSSHNYTLRTQNSNKIKNYEDLKKFYAKKSLESEILLTLSAKSIWKIHDDKE